MDQYLLYLKVYAFCLLRPLGMMIIFPLLSTKTLNGTLIRNGVMMSLAIPIFPVIYHMNILQDISAFNIFAIGLKEIIIGFFIGFSASIPFWAIDMAGFIIDNMRGASMASVFNPLMGTQASLFGLLFNQVLSALFLITGGFNMLIKSLYNSFNIIPINQTLNLNKNIILFFKNEWHIMFDLGISFAMPAIVIMLMIDIALGLVNRSAQQLNVFFLARPIKSAMAILLIIVSLNFSLENYINKMKNFEGGIHEMLIELGRSN